MMHLYKGRDDALVQGWGGYICTRVGRIDLYKGGEDTFVQGWGR